jgi:hypothetical protein
VFDVVAPSFKVTALEASARSPYLTGQTVDWTAVIDPPSLASSLEYQFWILNKSTGVWTIARPYGPGTDFTWKPGWNEAGSYALQVWARYQGATTKYNGWNGAEFRIDRGVGRLESDKAFPIPPGTTVTWTADAGGGASIEYQFWRMSHGTWSIVQDYSTDNTWSRSFADADRGTEAVQVWARTVGSPAKYEVWGGTGYFQIARSAPSVVAVYFSTPPRSGAATVIAAAASGGYAGPLQFRFWVYSAATSTWTMIRDYSSQSSTSWTPSTPGSYNVQVWVRSAGSTDTYEAWTGTPAFNVP